MHLQTIPNDTKLYGAIKGHLCRKLFGCTKVKSIVKTVQVRKNHAIDCHFIVLTV